MRLFVTFIFIFIFCMVGFMISYFIEHSVQDMIFWGVLAVINNISLARLDKD